MTRPGRPTGTGAPGDVHEAPDIPDAPDLRDGPGIPDRADQGARAASTDGPPPRRPDPRPRILAALAMGPMVLQSGPIGLGLLGLAFGAVLVVNRRRLPFGPSVLSANALFIVFWTVIKCALDLWNAGWDPAGALMPGLLLGARLAALMALGLALAAMIPAREMGLALVFFLRPILGRGAWRAALALALMVQALPLALATAESVRRGVMTRCARLSLRRRLAIYPAALLRAMSLSAEKRVLAVAGRDLDRPGAWDRRPPFRPGEWLAALAAVALAHGASLC